MLTTDTVLGSFSSFKFCILDHPRSQNAEEVPDHGAFTFADSIDATIELFPVVRPRFFLVDTIFACFI